MWLCVMAAALAGQTHLGVGVRDSVGEQGVAEGPRLVARHADGSLAVTGWVFVAVQRQASGMDQALASLTGTTWIRRDQATLGAAFDWAFGLPQESDGGVAVAPHLLAGVEARLLWKARVEMMGTTEEALVPAVGPVLGIAAQVDLWQVGLRLAVLDRMVIHDRALTSLTPTGEVRLMHDPTVTFDVTWRL